MRYSTNFGFSLNRRGEVGAEGEDTGPGVEVGGAGRPEGKPVSAISFNGLAFLAIVSGEAWPERKSLAAGVGQIAVTFCSPTCRLPFAVLPFARVSFSLNVRPPFGTFGVGHIFTSSANTFPPVPGARLPGIPALGVGQFSA